MRKSFKIPFIVICLLIFVLPAFGDTGSRVFEHGGNFSYRPPLSWELGEFPGFKFKFIIGPIESGFGTNMNFVDESFNGGLQAYVAENLNALETLFPDYKLVSRIPFTTHTNIQCERVVYEISQYGFNLKAATYFLPVSESKYIVATCMTVASAFEKYLPIFDECLKTFELID